MKIHVLIILLISSVGLYAGEAQLITEITNCLLPVAQKPASDVNQDDYADEIRNIGNYLAHKNIDELSKLANLCRNLIPSGLALPKYYGSEDINFSNSLAYLKFIWDTKNVKNAEEEVRNEIIASLAKIDGLQFMDRMKKAVEVAVELVATNEAVIAQKLAAIMDANPLVYDKKAIADNSIVNLMWLNKDLSLTDYIFPDPYFRAGVKIDIFERIKTWAHNFPKVIFWYNSNKTSATAVANTEKEIRKRLGEDANKVSLRDVKSLGEDISQHSSVYFQTDFFRSALTRELLQNSPLGTFVIYADVSITPFSRDELFDKITVFNLNTYGFVLPVNPGVKLIENNFHIMGNNVPNLLKAYSAAVIDLNARRATTPNLLIRGHEKLDQIVWASYTAFYLLFYYLENKISEGNFKSINRNMSAEDITNKLWNSPLRDSTGIVPVDRETTNETLRLQTAAQALPAGGSGIYVPIKIDEKFPVSHYTQTQR